MATAFVIGACAKWRIPSACSSECATPPKRRFRSAVNGSCSGMFKLSTDSYQLSAPFPRQDQAERRQLTASSLSSQPPPHRRPTLVYGFGKNCCYRQEDAGQEAVQAGSRN